MIILDKTIGLEELSKLAANYYVDMINIRPRQNNMSRDVENESTRSAILSIVDKYISK